MTVNENPALGANCLRIGKNKADLAGVIQARKGTYF